MRQLLLTVLIAAFAWQLNAIAPAEELIFAHNHPGDFGRRWVRSHPFTLMALILQDKAVEGDNRYVEAGLNTMLVWKNDPAVMEAAVRCNVPWHYHFNKHIENADDIKTKVDQLLKKYPGGQGFLVWDEPKLPDMRLAGERIAWIKQAHPELLVYSNVNPIKPPFTFSFPNLAGEKHLGDGVFDEPSVPYTYDDHLDNLAQIVNSDVLMGDIYPFWAPETLNPQEYLRDQYFFMLTAFRKAGLKHSRPYWLFVQAYEHPGRCRYPSESDVRMEVFSGLAFGFTGIAYFTYDTSLPHGRSMLNHDFSQAPLYDQINELNSEVAHLGKALRLITSTDVRYLRGNRMKQQDSDKNPLPRGMVAFDSRSRVAKDVREVEFHGTGPYDNGLIGFFRDDGGGKYFMVVNLQHGEGQSADAVKAPLSLTLDSSISAVYRLSRESGQAELIPIIDGKLQVELPGGTGDLFKIGDAQFPGIDS